jgi:hypothetical protein
MTSIGNEAPAVSVHALYDANSKDPTHDDARVSDIPQFAVGGLTS